MATKLPAFTQGDTPLFQFPVTINGVAQTLTGYVGLFTITPDTAPTSDSDAPIQLTYTFTGSEGGVASFQTTETQTIPSNLPAKTYNWSFKLKDPTATYYSTLVSGTVVVKQSYTIRNS